MKFAPTAGGEATGSLSIGYKVGTQAGTGVVALSGTGRTLATDTLSATSLTFAATPEGQISASQQVTLTNTGDLPLTGISVWASLGYQTSNNCGTTLTGQAGCSINVVFVPDQTGSEPGTLSIVDAGRTQTVALSGSGLQPPALVCRPPR